MPPVSLADAPPPEPPVSPDWFLPWPPPPPPKAVNPKAVEFTPGVAVPEVAPLLPTPPPPTVTGYVPGFTGYGDP